MRNNRKLSGIAIVTIGLILIILIIYFGFIKKEPTLEPVITDDPFITGQLPGLTDDSSATTPGDRPRSSQLYDISQEPPHQTNENDLVKLAQLFADRLGSYSNYSNYSNYADLILFMTDDMKIWANNYVDNLRENSQNDGEYYGVTTTAVLSKVLSYNNNTGDARIMVTTQRRESTSQVNEGQAYLQDIEITLKKVNDNWLVDKAYWQER